uniref:(northern house mosquito) hypothetical protein n=1 Tax=Culex pipiens TaxID=7175 RepID=A0A8D8GDY0_CULPI
MDQPSRSAEQRSLPALLHPNKPPHTDLDRRVFAGQFIPHANGRNHPSPPPPRPSHDRCAERPAGRTDNLLAARAVGLTEWDQFAEPGVAWLSQRGGGELFVSDFFGGDAELYWAEVGGVGICC